jgi:hypothetical protein
MSELPPFPKAFSIIKQMKLQFKEVEDMLHFTRQNSDPESFMKIGDASLIGKFTDKQLQFAIKHFEIIITLENY